MSELTFPLRTVAKISLNDSHYKIIEDEGYVDICVQLKTDIKRNVEFELTVIELTAQGIVFFNNFFAGLFGLSVHVIDGSDFDSPAVLTGTFVVGGVDVICFRFNITDDNCVEDKEYFGVLLLSSDDYVDIHTAAASVYIVDDDCKCRCCIVVAMFILLAPQMQFLV